MSSSSHRFLTTFLSLTFLCVLVVQGFEFDRDSCHSLLPNQKLRLVDNGKQGRHPRIEHEDGEDEKEEYDDEEHLPGQGWAHEIRPNPEEHDMESNTDRYHLKPGVAGRSPFIIKTSVAIYRRNRPLTVTIEGPEFNAFILMAKPWLSSTPKPVGTFQNLPASAKFLYCVHTHDTATNRDTGGKMNIKLEWKAPDEDNGALKFTGTVVQKDVYWAHLESESIIFKQFPPSFAECGRSKSCYRYSTKVPNCQPDQCDYVVITKITEENEIEFTIGGIMENNGYIGIGFTLDKYRLSHVDLSTCIKNGENVDAKQFNIESWKNGPRNFVKITDVEDVDRDGQMIWCQYRRPLKGPGPFLADLTQSLHHAFLWGSLNETTGLPILPPKSDILFVPKPWNYTNTISMVHYVGGSAAKIDSSSFLQLTLVLSLFVQFSNALA